MAKDYYSVLGVARTATQDEIKRAFRKLAHQYHPDKGGGDEAKFKEVNEAYQVLSDETKRSQYDQFGSTFDQAGAGGGNPWGDFAGGGNPFQGFRTSINFEDLGDVFGDFFGFGRGRASTSPRTQQRGRDLEIDVSLTLREAAIGLTKTVQLESFIACAACHGSGAASTSSKKTCTRCKGKGAVETAQRTVFGTFAAQTVCDACGGEGVTIADPCTRCRGEGRVLQTQELEITIPAGIADGTTLRLRNKGEAGIRGTQGGDLFVNVRVAADAKFRRDGDDIYTPLTLTPSQAALGCTLTISTLTDPLEVSIPSGTQAGDLVRLKGKGMPHMAREGRGDHFLSISVVIPKKLSKKQKMLYEELAKHD